MILQMIRWWYTTGWLQAAKRVTGWALAVERVFSLSILVATLFAPWKRIVTSPGRGIDARMHATLDNLVSRCIGFIIRFFVIIAALLGMLGAFLGGLIVAALWPLIPLGVVIFAVKGITG